ncbi:MAG TPA: 2-oxoacid:ferredoxin oxidoreductase subunit beta [Candidatus Polarisedimenticolaceae bacterium]|nr:2-oxoacid:ferredoxin oxidoreductase subunit beta [Candidatus Polarisedimenticolaceae bacterium]
MSGGVLLTKKDFSSDQEVRWCPGCGDYAILASVQSVFPELGIPKEKFVVVSGIGCSSRFPYYMNTFGFHTIHGRAPAVATGVKIANPDLSVWIATGDGDALSIGGNHIIHLMRRNVDVKVMLFNNRIYGLTKGQYSPTSEVGKKTKSTPFGSVDRPFNPISVAIGSRASFVARSVDVYAPHLKEVLHAAAKHKGTAFIEIFQNCNIFNDLAFEQYREKELRDDNVVHLKHGEPLIFGKAKDRGIRMNGFTPEVVTLGNGVTEKDLVVHDVKAPAAYAFMLSQMEAPAFPTPIGVLRDIDAPVLEAAMHRQIDDVVASKGKGDLQALIYGGETWDVV